MLARVRTHLALQAGLLDPFKARQRIDELLHAVLPKKAADEIRSIGTVIPPPLRGSRGTICGVVLGRTIEKITGSR